MSVVETIECFGLTYVSKSVRYQCIYEPAADMCWFIFYLARRQAIRAAHWDIHRTLPCASSFRPVHGKGKQVPLGAVACVCYADDFFLCFPFEIQHGVSASEWVINVFETVFEGLDFTYELPEHSPLRFLDIEIHESKNHTCWEYKTKNEEGIYTQIWFRPFRANKKVYRVLLHDAKHQETM